MLAYLVGLIATDGCLVTGRKQINFKSKDRELVALYLELLGRTNVIGAERTRTGGIAFKAHFGDAEMYAWLQSIGLTPRKSLSLGAIAVPDPFLRHAVRGLLDGDGSILNYVYRGTGKAHGTYEALTTCFVSASSTHVEWLRERLRSALAVSGSIGRHRAYDRTNAIYRLAYAKRESELLLPWIYPDQSVPCLSRKRAIWDAYRSRRGIPGDTMESSSPGGGTEYTSV